MWRVLLSLMATCLLMSCYNSRAFYKDIVYPNKIETEDYTIYRDATKIPNWSEYYKSMKDHMKSHPYGFGPSLYRGGGPWSSVGDGRGIYIDVAPDSEYLLFFIRSVAFVEFSPEDTTLAYILLKSQSSPETTELLIPNDDIHRILPPGLYEVFGFNNEELVLQDVYLVSSMDPGFCLCSHVTGRILDSVTGEGEEAVRVTVFLYENAEFDGYTDSLGAYDSDEIKVCFWSSEERLTELQAQPALREKLQLKVVFEKPGYRTHELVVPVEFIYCSRHPQPIEIPEVSIPDVFLALE